MGSWVSVREPGNRLSPDPEPASALTLGFPASRTTSNKRLWFVMCPDDGILLQQPELTRTLGYYNFLNISFSCFS